MPVITELRPSKKSADLILLYVDNRFYLRLPVDLVVKHHLTLGSEISKKLERQVKIETSSQYFFDRAANFLSYRPRSQSEISFYLKTKLKVSPQSITKILNKLVHLGLQDDNSFTDWLIRSRTNQGKSILFIKRELQQKGIDHEMIQDKLESLDSPLPKESKILNIFQKYKRKDPRTALLKTKYYFAGKGFTQSDLKKITEIIKNVETPSQ